MTYEIDSQSHVGPAKRNAKRANTSLILGTLGLCLPYPVFIFLGFKLNDYLISTIGLWSFNVLNALVPLVLSIAGPIGIIIGRLALQQNDSDVNIPKTLKSRATAGIVLGTLATVLIFLPLLCLWLPFVFACKNGC